MKSIVIYYSQSGNTKKIAHAIHAGMSESGEPCDLARLKDVSPKDLSAYDLIGIGSPTIDMREPPNVTSFIEEMISVDGKHGFAFNTHGALPSRHLSSVVPAMEQRGLTIIGWNDWFGSVVFPVLPKPYFTDGHPDDIDLKEAADFGKDLVERSRRIYEGETQLIPTFPKGKAYDEIYYPVSLTPPFEGLHALEFTVNKEKCNYPKCTYCIDNCPTGCIDFSVSPPNFNICFLNIRCVKCFQCEQTCPKGAIEVDYATYQESTDPLIPLLEGTLEVFEKRGDFRRLVPLEDIGWDTPLWHRKHPRFKIDY